MTRSRASFLLALLALSTITLAVGGDEAPTKGHLVLIGGGDKPPEVMRKFVELAGGKDAPIVAIPTASSEPDAADYYEKLFRDDLGCTDAVSLRIRSKADAQRADYAALARKARGIFFGGGDQVRIVNALPGTPVGDAIAAAHAEGAVVGGTSAGTACQSERMITGEGDFTQVRTRSVELWTGLGFLPPDVVVDQHFLRRQRQNRLLSVVLENPGLLGVGVDEETAIWVRPDGTLQVLGRSGVMVFDAQGAAVSRQQKESAQDLLGVRGLTLHLLLPGDTYDLKTRLPLRPAPDPPAPVPPESVPGMK
ncbi:MAG: cyanophycinase [Thermoanaerobaculia bacterium]|nr:cyanophycinase [Thermoanaerobaculia bacterium]